MTLQSCGGHFYLSTKGCDHTTRWTLDPPPSKINKFKVKHEVQYDVEIEHVLYMGSNWTEHPDKIYLNDIFKKNELTCRDFEYLNISSMATLKDILVGLIPFVTRKTLIIQGIKK